MTPAQDATVQRRRLRTELRRARSSAGFTQRDVAEAMDWSLSKLNRIESGLVGISTTDLKALLQHYGIVDPAEVDRFLSLARAGKEQRAWWAAYKEATSQQYLTFLGYESSAALIQMFQPLLIPGLLQEEEYARAVLRAYGGSATDKRVEEWVELRLRRQEELVERPAPPEMVFVLDEAVLFLENPRGDTISRDEQEEIKPYREAFLRLRELARESDLNTLIDKVLEQMS